MASDRAPGSRATDLIGAGHGERIVGGLIRRQRLAIGPSSVELCFAERGTAGNEAVVEPRRWRRAERNQEESFALHSRQNPVPAEDVTHAERNRRLGQLPGAQTPPGIEEPRLGQPIFGPIYPN